MPPIERGESTSRICIIRERALARAQGPAPERVHNGRGCPAIHRGADGSESDRRGREAARSMRTSGGLVADGDLDRVAVGDLGHQAGLAPGEARGARD